ncbi:hypothetical protein Tco_1389807, partial [Tanacetum coccineum]
VERAITTVASLVAAQDSDNIIRTQTTAMPNVDIPQGMDTGGSPKCQETMGDAPAQTRSERVLKLPNELHLLEDHTSRSGEGRMEYTFELMDIVSPTPYELPLPEGYTPRSDDGRLELEELMAMCIKLSKQVLDLEKEKDAQAVEILKLKKRVESFDNDLDEEDASKQERYSDKTKPMFKDSDFDVLDDAIEDVDVSTARPEVSAASVPMNVSVATLVTPPTITTVFDNDEDLTIAQTLVKMRSEKAKEKGVAFRDVEETPKLTTTRSTTTLQPLPTIDPKDKAKGVLVKEEPEKRKTIETIAATKKFRGASKGCSDQKRLYEREQKWINDFFPMDSEKEEKKSVELKSEDKEETVDPEILSAKYPIVDWESQNLGNVDMEDLHVYKIIRADGNTSYHKSLFSMLRKFDRQDLVDLHRLVMKRFEDNTPEGYNLLLWGDLKIMFEPNAEDEIWSNQQDWTLISWKLYENCGVHTLL